MATTGTGFNMGKFLTPLQVKEVSRAGLFSKAKYRLTAPLVYQSSHVGVILVEECEETDFDSTPRVPIFYMWLGDRGRAAAALHDHLYTPPHETITGSGDVVSRAMADAILRGATYECLRVDNPTTLWDSVTNILSLGVVWAIWVGVRLGGWAHWKQY